MKTETANTTFNGADYLLTRHNDDPAQPWEAKRGGVTGNGATSTLALRDCEARFNAREQSKTEALAQIGCEEHFQTPL